MLIVLNIYIDISTDEQYIYIDYRDDGCGFDYNSIGKVKIIIVDTE